MQTNFYCSIFCLSVSDNENRHLIAILLNFIENQLCTNIQLAMYHKINSLIALEREAIIVNLRFFCANLSLDRFALLSRIV